MKSPFAILLLAGLLMGLGTAAHAAAKPPSRTRLPAQISWTNHADPAIRYYSGRARYSRTITISEEWLAENRRLEVVVTNYWANRIVGDEQPGAVRFTPMPLFAPLDC
jgi:hypothetical protein